MARDPQGRILGYDYQGLDRRPFDREPSSDPFFPDDHGTRIASLVLDGAPVAKLVPYRYPRDAMARMTALIEAAASHGVRLMNLSLASRDRDQWLPFLAAARVHPEILFVVAAGNDGADIEQQPYYPAAFHLANMVVVTSGTGEGRLTAGVNWSRRKVDLMVSGENVVAMQVDGRRRRFSGSSYATAKVSAFAACLLAHHPGWSTAELKAAILAKADPAREPERIARGFISNLALADHSLCAGDRSRTVAVSP